MTDADALDLAEKALVFWGGSKDAPRLVKNRENIVLDVHLTDGRHVALRLHRPGYQTEAAITSELLLTRAFGETGLPVAVPVATRDGALLVPGKRVASCVGWLDGHPIGSAETELDGTRSDQHNLMQRLGYLVARLHVAADGFKPGPGFSRHDWDIDGLLGPDPLWGRFWENPSLHPAEARQLASARDMARDLVSGLSGVAADRGLIHADVLRENVLASSSGLALIDFDDCGWGYRLYDLGTSLVQGIGQPGLADHARGLIAGYGACRALPDNPESHIALFVCLRGFASCGWTIGRYSADHPVHRRYAERALWLADRLRARKLPLEQGV